MSFSLYLLSGVIIKQSLTKVLYVIGVIFYSRSYFCSLNSFLVLIVNADPDHSALYPPPPF